MLLLNLLDELQCGQHMLCPGTETARIGGVGVLAAIVSAKDSETSKRDIEYLR